LSRSIDDIAATPFRRYARHFTLILPLMPAITAAPRPMKRYKYAAVFVLQLYSLISPLFRGCTPSVISSAIILDVEYAFYHRRHLFAASLTEPVYA